MFFLVLVFVCFTVNTLFFVFSTLSLAFNRFAMSHICRPHAICVNLLGALTWRDE